MYYLHMYSLLYYVLSNYTVPLKLYDTGEKIAFPAGEKKFKFSLNLSPLNGELPGTMKNSYGFILYQVIIYMKQELRTFKQAEKVITVGSFYSLSHQGKGIFAPVVCENLGKSPSMLQFLGIGSSKGSSDRLGVTFRMNRSGYVRGISCYLHICH